MTFESNFSMLTLLVCLFAFTFKAINCQNDRIDIIDANIDTLLSYNRISQETISTECILFISPLFGPFALFPNLPDSPQGNGGPFSRPVGIQFTTNLLSPYFQNTRLENELTGALERCEGAGDEPSLIISFLFNVLTSSGNNGPPSSSLFPAISCANFFGIPLTPVNGKLKQVDRFITFF